MFIRSIRELDLKNKILFLRLDLNVPLVDGKIEEDHRIREALPTLNHAIEQGAKVIIASHLGRPKGGTDKDRAAFSLEPVANRLAEILAEAGKPREVLFAEDCIADANKLLFRNMKAGDVLVLENLRFSSGEEKNEPEFVRKLAAGIDVYVTDAFGTTHRKHASTFGLPEFLKSNDIPIAMGLLIEKELRFLDQLLQAPQNPFYLLLGGAKVSDKIKTIQSLLQRVQGICVGGAMAFAFLKAQGKALPEGCKLPSTEDVTLATQILRDAKSRHIPVILPEDFAPQGKDIGENSIVAFKSFLSKAKTIFWNGPLGMCEDPQYAKGTFALAEFIGSLPALKVVGGGETVAAIHDSGHTAKFDHLSTGGGAVLEYLEGEGLPGIEILKVYEKRERISKPL